jgi:hypothetical protein
VWWICQKGHEWEAAVKNRAGGSGCVFCARNRVLPGFNDLATTHPDLANQAVGWDPMLINRGSGKKVKWRCVEGHVWKAVVSNRAIQGKGCPTCADSGFDPNKLAHLYFLIQEDWGMFQIGITNDITRRLEEHSRNGWVLLGVRGPMDGHLTRDWERAILRMLKAKGADLSNAKIAGKFDGYSEAWLKDSLQVANIKQLLDWVYEDEN